MSRTEDFDSEFWADADVADLTVTARYLYIWTWTNPRCNMSGAYQVTPALIGAETGLTRDEIDETFAELADHRFAFYDGRVLWVRARVKRLRQKTDNIAKSIVAHLAKLPSGHPYVRMFVHEYRNASFLDGHISNLSVDPLVTLTDGSGEGHVTQPVEPKSLTLYRGSADPPRDGLGDRDGNGEKETRAHDPEITGLCQHLADRMLANDPKAKVAPDSDRWLTDMRLLVQRDERPAAEVRRIIDFCQADQFWRANVLSPGKLREKFGQLLLKAQTPAAGGKPALANTRDFSRFDKAVGA